MFFPRIVISCLCLGFVLAVPMSTNLNFVVTASRFLSTYPNSTLISEEDVHRYKDFSIGDILQGEPGVQANRYGGKGGVNALSLQGANSNQTLILRDGIPMKNAVYGTVDLNNINLEQVQEIQLYRGGMSAVYGADAVGGVINIVSSRTLGQNKLSLELGSYGNQNLSLAYSQGTVASNVQLSLLHGRYDGYLPVGYFNNDILAIEYNEVLLHDYKVRVAGSAYSDQRGNPAGLYSASEQKDQGYCLETQIGDNDRSGGRLYFTTKCDERTAISGAVSDSKGWSNTLGGTKEFRLVDHAIILGLETEQMIPNDSILSQNHSLQNDAAYINDDWSFSPWWKMNMGVRQDQHSRFGTADTYKFSQAFLLGGDCSLKMSYGTSFRAPSLADLYCQDSYGSVGNPNLRPETARNIDLELTMRTSIGSFRTSYFEKKVNDLIEWGSSADWSSSSPNNVGRARLSGMETEWFGSVGEAILYNLNWTQMLDASDEKTGAWLQNRAKTKVNMALNMGGLSGSLSIRANYVSERLSMTGGSIALPSYWVVDMDYTKDIYSLFVHNVFNQTYEEYSGYVMPGRTGGIKVSISF